MVGWDEGVEDVRMSAWADTAVIYLIISCPHPQLVSPSPPSPLLPASASTSGRTAAGTVPTVRYELTPPQTR